MPQLLELQRERTWQPLEGAELRDVTVGIVGLGSIGRAVGALATAFGCRVVAVRRRGAEEGSIGETSEGDGASDSTVSQLRCRNRCRHRRSKKRSERKNKSLSPC